MTQKPQHIRVLEYLHYVGALTSLTALSELGIISFPKRISQLRQQGISIDDEFVTVTNRFGEEVTVKQYTLDVEGTDMEFVDRLERTYDVRRSNSETSSSNELC